jgi:hypothetical protein
MLLLDQPATATWTELGNFQKVEPGSKVANDLRTKDFTSVRDAVKFVMETLNSASRTSAQIKTDGALLHKTDIETLYPAALTS